MDLKLASPETPRQAVDSPTALNELDAPSMSAEMRQIDLSADPYLANLAEKKTQKFLKLLLPEVLAVIDDLQEASGQQLLSDSKELKNSIFKLQARLKQTNPVWSLKELRELDCVLERSFCILSDYARIPPEFIARYYHTKTEGRLNVFLAGLMTGRFIQLDTGLISRTLEYITGMRVDIARGLKHVAS